jgi:predicted acylesterase/phospholipase RssA
MSSEVKTGSEFLQELGYGEKKLILSIDGGGTKGLLPLHCLKKLEELAGKPCYELFDFYAGTSTGAIIAGALACRMTAEEIIELYRTFIKDIFPPQPRKTFAGWIAQAGLDIAQFFGLKAIGSQIEESLRFLIANDLKYLYDHQKLWELTRDRLRMPGSDDSPLTLGDIYEKSKSEFGTPKRLMITFKDVERSETLFAVNGGPGAPAFAEMPLTYAVLASATAPVYLEPFRVWVDGGVGSYSNPCYRAVIEATDYFTGKSAAKDYELVDDDKGYDPENIIVFSFGTGHIPNFRTYEDDVARMSFFDWMGYVISEQMDEANDEQVLLTQDHFREVDFRRYQLTLDPGLLQEPVERGGIGFDLSTEDKSRLAHLTMASSKQEDTDLMDRLGQAWAEAIGSNFARAHYPFASTTPYWPAGAVPLRVPAELRDTVPSALREYRNQKLRRLVDYLEGKVSELERSERYRLAH